VIEALHIYLRDHLAGATFGVEMIERCRRKNQHTKLAAPLADLAREIGSDRDMLITIMRRLGADRSKIKVSAAWLFEKVRRLKPNGRVLSYTPLSRLVDLEGLAMGVAGKRAMWRVLEDLASNGGPLHSFDFAALVERADSQLKMVERLRLEAARAAFDHHSESTERQSAAS
jgi:hypothetical protein